MDLADRRARHQALLDRAGAYSRVADANVRREYPHAVLQTVTGPGQRAEPHELHPAFYGSFDWHSCVEMHWLAARLLRHCPQAVDAPLRETLSGHLTPDAIGAEVAFLAGQPTFERPYGWGWALALAWELHGWDDPDGRAWAAALDPLVDWIVDTLVAWLPKLTYPVRAGTHPNTAFALARSWPPPDHRRAGELRGAIAAAASDWFAGDHDYPGGWEPSGTDFLSPALAEAELMSLVLDADGFGVWCNGFLPGWRTGYPTALFSPVSVTDDTDGHLAHLHGLNLSRAWGWRRVAETLGGGTDRLWAAAARHAEVGLPAASGSDYMVEHWLAAYAGLVLGP